MSQTGTLPSGWGKILDEVRERLDGAVALADERMARVPESPPAPFAEDRRRDLEQLCARLVGLGEQLQKAQALIQDVDHVLAAEEASLRHQQAIGRALPGKLAEWADRR